MPVTKHCEQCGNAYTVSPSRASKSRFCCAACANASRFIPNKRSGYTPKPGGLSCAICGNSFWALGVHVKHKHGISAKDYKAEYGHFMRTPLVHPEISKAIKESAKARLADPEYRDEVAQRCRENSKANHGMKRGSTLSQAGTEALAKRNHDRNEQYLLSKVDAVQESLDRTGYISHAAKELGMGAETIKKMASRGWVNIPPLNRSIALTGRKWRSA